MDNLQELATLVNQENIVIKQIKAEISKVVVGQTELVDRLILALLCNQHVLIEGLPGLAKTLTVTTLAKAIQASFHRLQFTPDLLPADLIGTLVYNPKSGEFYTKKGPIFADIVLADEINRAPAKIQSALLEAMQERQVTIGDESFPLGNPFLVLATQNPIEQEGTYPLPEAQVDRFMFKLKVGYPTKDEEKQILHNRAKTTLTDNINTVIGISEILRIRNVVDAIYMDEKIENYIVDIIEASRNPEEYGLKIKNLIRYGASPRASIFLAMAAKGNAFLAGRPYVVPQDVKDIGFDVLRHRIGISYEAEVEEKTSEDIIQQIFDAVKVP